MKAFYINLIILVCVVIEINGERTRSGMCKGCPLEEYIRIKRAKYNSGPPIRFYNRPPMSHPIKGAFSFTPPPGYLMDDGRQPQYFKPKVSSRPTNEGLGDEDINNIMRFLSKQDLDKIMAFANEKDRESQKYNIELMHERPNYVDNRGEKYGNKVIYNDNDPELNYDNKILTFKSTQENSESYNTQYNRYDINESKESKLFKFPTLEPTVLDTSKNKMPIYTQLGSDRTLQNQQIFNLNAYAHPDATENRNGANIFSSLMQEEQLPKPSNLREEDFEVSYTNNVPKVVKPDSSSYEIENLGKLPLMNYHSKLDTVDSYKVPHYTITSPEKSRTPLTSAQLPMEPAPPASTAQEQSDAHLKATKIWTHKSKGIAYTLHDDGTLSLEKPTRPKTNYG